MFRVAMKLLVVCLILAVLYPQISTAQWSAMPGETVRNGFGPVKNQGAPACRGACGLDCPSSCDQEVQFECAGAGTLTRVKSYRCGTHQGCRQHDDCLDRCSQQHAEGYDCQAECHTEAVNDWGLEMTGSWALGGGPFDTQPIVFEYTMDTPAGAEAIYRCPEGSRQQCGATKDGCVAAGRPVDPVFDSFAGGPAGAIQVFGFRSGPVCFSDGQPSSVCQPAIDIQVNGKDSCAHSGGIQRCTWYGFELNYRNADPTEPLICQTSGADEDFLGGIVSRVIEAGPAESDTDMGKLLGGLQKQLQSGKSLDQVFAGITVTTEDGETLGGTAPEDALQQPGVPTEVALNGSSGHLLVPMFEMYDASPPGSSVEHQIRCLQQGQPVIETTFRLHFAVN